MHVILTEELGAVPPPSHSWMAPLMEDMLHDARTGLTEAVVIGPGRAVLFYGRCSMGEHLTADETRDAASLLTGVGTWVGKLAYLTADPMTIKESWWAIAQAIMDYQVKVREPGYPHVNLLAQQPFRFDPPERLHYEGCLWGMVAPIINHHHLGHWEAKNATDVWETKGLCHLSSPYLPQIMGLRATGVHYQWLPQCHLGMTGEMGPNIPDEGDGTREDGAHMKVNLPIFKDEDAKDAVTYQSWRWDLIWCINMCRVQGLHTLLPYAIRSLQGYPGELVWSY